MTAVAPVTPSVPHSRRSFWVTDFYHSALGKKAVMALTGIFLFGWIFILILSDTMVKSIASSAMESRATRTCLHSRRTFSIAACRRD